MIRDKMYLSGELVELAGIIMRRGVPLEIGQV